MLIMIISFLLGFTGICWGSEVQIFEHKIYFTELSELSYCHKTYIQRYQKITGKTCSVNEPFASFAYSQLPFLEHFSDFRKITDRLPLSLCIEGDKFKPKGTELFTLKRQKDEISYELKVIVGTDFKNRKPEELIEKFRNGPRCFWDWSGGTVQYFIQQGILADLDGKIIHGPKGYFGADAYNEEVSKVVWKKRKESVFFYASYFKIPIIISSAGCIIWLLYKRYHH